MTVKETIQNMITTMKEFDIQPPYDLLVHPGLLLEAASILNGDAAAIYLSRSLADGGMILAPGGTLASEELYAAEPVTPQVLAYHLAAAVDERLAQGGTHYRDSQGRVITTLDQFVQAVEAGRWPVNGQVAE